MQTPTPIKSFVRREGRLTSGQRKALDILWDNYVLASDQGKLNWLEVFERPCPTILDIGFGMGHSLVAMAEKYPDQNFLGMEVYRPGIGTLLTQLQQKNLTNVRVLYGDAQLLTAQCLSNLSLAGVQLFFPDPWPKKRHQKRRLVQTAFIELLATKLAPGGYLHLATDWADYAQHMQQVLADITCFEQLPPNTIDRPLTKYEQRGKALGHNVWDLKFTKSLGN